MDHLRFIPELFDSSNYSVQPSSSQNDEWLVYAKAANNIWSETDLFIASKTGVINSVSENMKLHGSVFPNPVNNTLNIKFNTKQNQSVNFNIYSIDGRLCFSQNVIESDKVTVDVSDFYPGIYIYSLKSQQDFFQGKFIIQK